MPRLEVKANMAVEAVRKLANVRPSALIKQSPQERKRKRVTATYSNVAHLSLAYNAGLAFTPYSATKVRYQTVNIKASYRRKIKTGMCSCDMFGRRVVLMLRTHQISIETDTRARVATSRHPRLWRQSLARVHAVAGVRARH